MTNELFEKLRQWEKEDEAEVTQSKFGDGIVRLKTLRSRLDMLLGAAVTSLIFGLCLAVLNTLGKL